MRHQTGLRNKYRSGRGWYSKRKKGLKADRYGRYSGGILMSSETVAGTVIDKQLPSADRKR